MRLLFEISWLTLSTSFTSKDIVVWNHLGFMLSFLVCFRLFYITTEPLLSCFSVRQFNPLSVNFTKWSNTLKQFVVKLPTNCLWDWRLKGWDGSNILREFVKLPTNCLSVFNHFVRLALEGLRWLIYSTRLELCNIILVRL